jgi:heat shock 70kDa protein 1/2/6/8
LLSSVCNVKRLIGRTLDEAEVQADLKRFPFKVISKGGNLISKLNIKV